MRIPKIYVCASLPLQKIEMWHDIPNKKLRVFRDGRHVRDVSLGKRCVEDVVDVQLEKLTKEEQ